MFAKRLPDEYKSLKNAMYDNHIMSFLSSSDGGQIIIKFKDVLNCIHKIIFFIPSGYPTYKMSGYFMNNVPAYNFYKNYTVDTNITNIFKCPNNMLSYVNEVKNSIEVNELTKQVNQMSL